MPASFLQVADGAAKGFELAPHFGQFGHCGELQFLIALGRRGDAQHDSAVRHVVRDSGHGAQLAPVPMCTWSRKPAWPPMTT